MKRFFFSLLCCLQLAGACYGRGEGTTAASFLKIDAAARPAAMAGALCAAAADANALNYNCAGLAGLDHREITVTHSEWIAGVRNEFASYTQPVTPDIAVGASVNYLYLDGMTERDSEGVASGRTFGASDSAVTVGAGMQLREALAVGGSLKIISESLDNKSASAVAFDAGMLYWWNERCRIGAALRNVGTGVTLDTQSSPLPFALAAGAGYYINEYAAAEIDLITDLNGNLDARLGGEYMVSDMFMLRAGYNAAPDTNTGYGLSAGFGITQDNWRFDYAYLPMGDLGDTHRFSLNIRL